MKIITVNKAWCKKCGICIAFCPKQVLEKDGDGYPEPTRSEECIGCRLCEMRCPDFAMAVKMEG
ncbi:4Fe-4S dicluster domain-containing protein [Caproiciproducens sp. NJN-50]|uniref:4Fe-4S dicluster domain-containing protein n=1 Tax=Acutalibacteraceae TaxID=3082771 RepID=UPI000FFE0930|nr:MULTISPECIES: 4Fe-4S binding protein [Acutalibacteraceae]QAT48366.1 4Fe-4S dicluster domain-containing protein [Caproiciproducens sp. NJN-50]